SHVWLYDSSGQRRQLTIFGDSSRIDRLAENGEVMLTSGGRRYRALPDGQLDEVGTSAGRAIYIDGQWFVAIGSSLFRVLL
ncbi:MAG: hypothetical protein AAF184_13940, partial [Pseudomonadota bacterium]